MTRFALGLVLCGSTLSAGCGARSSPPEGSGAASAGSAPSSSTASSSGGGAPLCRHWVLTTDMAAAVSPMSLNAELTGAFGEGDSVFVAWNDIDAPNVDPTWRAVVVGDQHVPPTPSTPVLSWPPNATRSGLRLAGGFGHRGAMAWDEAQRCRFVALASDGSAAGPPAKVDDDWCTGLVATPNGFTAFVSPAALLLRRDARASR